MSRTPAAKIQCSLESGRIVWSTALVVLMGELHMGRCACYCCLIDQPALTPPISGAADSLTGPGWAGCTVLSWLCLLLLDKWQRPSLVGCVVFKPLCFATSLWDPSSRAHMHSYLSAFAEAASIIARVCQCLWEIITWLKRIRMQLFVDKTMWGWQGKAILQELNFCCGLFPMGCQCDAQNQVQLGVPSVMSTSVAMLRKVFRG